MVEFSASAGIADVKVEVPMPSPETVRGWLHRFRRPNGSVHLRLSQADLTIDHSDEGTAVFFVEVINLWRRKVTIDRLLIQYWSWASHSLPDVTPTVNGIRSVIRRRSIRNLSMTISLDKKMVRIIPAAGVKAPNLFSRRRGLIFICGASCCARIARPNHVFVHPAFSGRLHGRATADVVISDGPRA